MSPILSVMPGRAKRLALLTAVLAIAASFVHSVQVRQEEPEVATPRVGDDPLTGAVLLDLADDLSATERDVLEARIHDAIAPYEWPTGDAALGETLSEAAQLFRLNAPRSELDDLRAARKAVGGVERHRADAVVAEMLLDFGNQRAAVGPRDLERVVDRREVAVEPDVEDHTLDLKDRSGVFCHCGAHSPSGRAADRT